MKKADRDLLADLLPDARREATLRLGARVLRRRRFARQLAFALPLAAAAAIAVVLRIAAPPAPSPQTAAPATVRTLSDDQLLAMFPGTPKALIQVKGGSRLVFTRPQDAARFIGRAAP